MAMVKVTENFIILDSMYISLATDLSEFANVSEINEFNVQIDDVTITIKKIVKKEIDPNQQLVRPRSRFFGRRAKSFEKSTTMTLTSSFRLKPMYSVKRTPKSLHRKEYIVRAFTTSRAAPAPRISLITGKVQKLNNESAQHEGLLDKTNRALEPLESLLATNIIIMGSTLDDYNATDNEIGLVWEEVANSLTITLADGLTVLIDNIADNSISILGSVASTIQTAIIYQKEIDRIRSEIATHESAITRSNELIVDNNQEIQRLFQVEEDTLDFVDLKMPEFNSSNSQLIREQSDAHRAAQSTQAEREAMGTVSWKFFKDYHTDPIMQDSEQASLAIRYVNSLFIGQL
jgi:hypothetical protein